MFIHIQANTYTQGFYAIVIHSPQKFSLEIKPRTHRKARIAALEIEKKRNKKDKKNGEMKIKKMTGTLFPLPFSTRLGIGGPIISSLLL